MDFMDAGILGGVFALALGLIRVVETLIRRLGSRNDTGSGSGSANGKMCFILEQQSAAQKEMLIEQRTTNEILRETRRDHERMTEQLARIEQEATQAGQR